MLKLKNFGLNSTQIFCLNKKNHQTEWLTKLPDNIASLFTYFSPAIESQLENEISIKNDKLQLP
jgi:hypothetical protein